MNPVASRVHAVANRLTDGRANLIPYLLPALLLFAAFVFWPMLRAIWFSLFNWNGFGDPERFVALANYIEAFGTPAFRVALANVGILIAVALLIQLPLALASALLVGNRFRGVVVYRLILLLPYVLAQTATGIVFTFLYDGQYGLAGKIAELVHADRIFVLGSETYSLPAIAAVMVWKYFGFGMMIFVAALQSLDHNIIDAAHIDGANRWQVLRHVTLPHLRRTMLLVGFFAVLGAVQMFDLVMSLTAGGPNNSSQTLVTYLYTHGLSRLRIGYGSAIGMILFFLCILLSIAYGRLGRRMHG